MRHWDNKYENILISIKLQSMRSYDIFYLSGVIEKKWMKDVGGLRVRGKFEHILYRKGICQGLAVEAGLYLFASAAITKDHTLDSLK